MADTTAIDVPFTDDEAVRDEDLITDDPATLAKMSPEQRETRNQRRRERAAEREAERKEQGQRLQRLEAELSQERAARARLEGHVQATARPETPQVDPIDSQLDAVYKRRREAFDAASAEMASKSWNVDRQKHYEQVTREVEADIVRLNTLKVLRPALAEQSNRSRQEAAQQTWAQRYPEVYGNPQAYAYAEASAARARALAGKSSLSQQEVEAVFDETRTTFKLGPKPTPSATERARMSGIPATGGNGGGAPTGGIAMTKELRAMAIAKYSNLPEDQAIKKWVDNEGKELRKQRVI